MSLGCLKDVGEREGRESIPRDLYKASMRLNSRLRS